MGRNGLHRHCRVAVAVRIGQDLSLKGTTIELEAKTSLKLNGGTIDMQLNPYASRNVLKVALLQ